MATQATSEPSTSTSASDAGPSGSQENKHTAAQRKTDRLARLRDLHLRRNEARKLNHQEVVEEDKRKKLPANWEAKKRRQEWEEEEEEKRKQCKEAGEEFDRVKMLDIQADQAERWDRMKKKKQNPDEGFSDYAQATHRQYQRLTKQMKPDNESYDRQKQKMGDGVYGASETTNIYDHKDSKEGIDRMVDDLEKQIEKRSKYSRRRAYDEDEDIDYINERNKNFNKKLERFYGKYTTEIKQNLERGTAV